MLDRSVGQVPVPSQEGCHLGGRASGTDFREVEFGEPDVPLERERQLPQQRRRRQRLLAVTHACRPQAAEVGVDCVNASQWPADAKEAGSDVQGLRQTVKHVGARRIDARLVLPDRRGGHPHLGGQAGLGC